MPTIGRVDYINTLPLFTALDESVISYEANYIKGPPTHLNALLRDGQIDISLISSAEFLMHQEKYELIPQIGIAATFAVKSVCLYTKKPLGEIKEIAITSQSASSAGLLKILCNHYWKINPHFNQILNIQDVKTEDAILLIGDDCLKNLSISGFQTIDLATVWHHVTGLPFVFAVFAARKGLCKEVISEFESATEQSLKWSLKNADKIAEKALDTVKLPLNVIQDYFRLLEYKLSSFHMKGMQKFAQLLGV